MSVDLLSTYRQAAADREALGIPPLPLSAAQTSQLCELLQHPEPKTQNSKLKTQNSKPKT